MEIDVKHPRDTNVSTCVGLTSDVLPEAQNAFFAKSSHTGVSTRNVPLGSSEKTLNLKSESYWYALRTTYGRERKAYDYLISKGIKAFLPTITNTKIENGKRKTITESRLPNIFFAYGTEEQIKTFVYDNVNLPFLRFYYRHFHEGHKIKQVPLIVPDRQIESLKIICEAEINDIIVSPDKISKFEVGQEVRIVDGAFKGVVGIVARYRGQQRVGVSIDGLMTFVTAYIPNAFIEII
jgi:hypothetical protein